MERSSVELVVDEFADLVDIWDEFLKSFVIHGPSEVISRTFKVIFLFWKLSVKTKLFKILVLYWRLWNCPVLYRCWPRNSSPPVTLKWSIRLLLDLWADLLYHLMMLILMPVRYLDRCSLYTGILAGMLLWSYKNRR